MSSDRVSVVYTSSHVLLFSVVDGAFIRSPQHLVAQRAIPSPANNEFVGMIESVTESLHGLLAEGPRSDSASDSNRGSHHPSRECFMAGTPEGHVKSIFVEEATSVDNLDDEAKWETVAPPRMGVEQLKARHREIEEA